MGEWYLTIFESGYYDFADGIMGLDGIRDPNNKRDVEARAPDPSNPHKDIAKIQEGDIVILRVIDSETFESVESLPTLKFRVKYNRPYHVGSNAEASVWVMLQAEGLSRLEPYATNLEEGVQAYMSFPGYPERIAQYGIHAIGLEERLY